MAHERIYRGSAALDRLAQLQSAPDIRARDFRWPGGDGSAPFPPPEGAGAVGPPPLVGRSAEAPYTRQLAPPWREKLGPVSLDFNAQDFELTLPAGAGSFVVGPFQQLPDASVGWLQQFQLYVQGPNNGTSIVFTLRINEGPVAGFGNRRSPPGVANLILIDINELQVRVPQGARIDVVITNRNANGPWTVGTGFAGWAHSLQAELDRWGPV